MPAASDTNRAVDLAAAIQDGLDALTPVGINWPQSSALANYVNPATYEGPVDVRVLSKAESTPAPAPRGTGTTAARMG